MTKKIFWKVDPAPSGPYSSFQSRGWPSGFSDRRGSVAIAHIVCGQAYHPVLTRTGEHLPLKVRVAIKNGTSFDWRQLRGDFKSLRDAKEAAQRFYDANPDKFLGQ